MRIRMTITKQVRVPIIRVIDRAGGEDFLNNRQAEALYNAGYRKVIGDGDSFVDLLKKAIDEITRLNSVQVELQKLNMKYYNEAKDLRRELAEAEAENERLSEKLRQLLSSIDTVKEMNAIARGTIDEYQEKAIKEFAEKLKAKCHDNRYWDSDSNDKFFVHVPGTITIDDVNELLNSVVDNSVDSTQTLN